MNEKKTDLTGLQNGVHPNPEKPPKYTSAIPLGLQTGPTAGQSSAKQAEVPPAKVREPYELQEQAWKLMDEAVRTGAMRLEDGTEVKLNADSLIRVIQWLASAKAKKPHLINPPEDFRLKETTSEKD
ncbi:hypothetical protein LCGC14_1275510 [marine sediment metagenome]|uniref:Uncharacterized protein n=1 Tax=marine sediment metagenome TaxID=412755 RepID=A0A0F9KYL6_9ZZZZ